jgi:hypothetical protein
MSNYFKKLQKQFKKIGFNVYNTTEGSKLKVFKSKSLLDAIKENMIDTRESTNGMYVSPSDKKKK